MIKFNDSHLKNFISDSEYDAMQGFVNVAHSYLAEKSGQGGDFLGWVDLPVNYDKEEFKRIKEAAEKPVPTARCCSS